MVQALGAEFDGGDLALLGSFMIEATLPLYVTAGPTATIDSPADGAVYSLFDEVVVDYGCSADAVSCIAWLEPGDSLPTNAIGTFKFPVTAMAEDGTARSSTHAYEVRLLRRERSILDTNRPTTG